MQQSWEEEQVKLQARLGTLEVRARAEVEHLQKLAAEKEHRQEEKVRC